MIAKFFKRCYFLNLGNSRIPITLEQRKQIWLALEQPFQRALTKDEIYKIYNIKL
jgi:hypothetical protein